MLGYQSHQWVNTNTAICKQYSFIVDVTSSLLHAHSLGLIHTTVDAPYMPHALHNKSTLVQGYYFSRLTDLQLAPCMLFVNWWTTCPRCSLSFFPSLWGSHDVRFTDSACLPRLDYGQMHSCTLFVVLVSTHTHTHTTRKDAPCINIITLMRKWKGIFIVSKPVTQYPQIKGE